MPGARYDDEVTIDAAAIRPTVTWGINPGQSVYVDEALPRPADVPLADRAAVVGGARVHGARRRGSRSRARGSTSRSSDRAPTRGCRTCARRRGWCAGRHVAPHVRALVVPGSQAVRLAAEREGLDRVFIEAGFDWRGAGCSMCLAMNPDELEGREICASSSNRNFKGRQGSPTGRTLLMSPAMVAAAAVAGEVVDVQGDRQPWPLRRSSRSAAARCRCAATTSTPTGSSRRGSCKSITFEGLEQHLFEDDRLQADAEAAARIRCRNPPTPARDPAGERQLRLRLVARARAAGDPPLGHPRGRRRVVLGDLLRQLRRARAAVRDRVARRHRAAAGDRRTRPVDRGHRRPGRRKRSPAAGSPPQRTLPPAARESFLDGTWDATGCCSIASRRSRRSRPAAVRDGVAVRRRFVSVSYG